MLLDTSFFIDLMRGDEAAVDTARRLEADLVQQRVSAMTLFELHYGIAGADEPSAERERVRRVVDSKPSSPADETVTRRAGDLAGAAAADGHAVDDADAIIAATAEGLGEPVLTRNVSDFEALGDVEVVQY